MRIPESELIINGDGSVFHIHLKPEQLADNVIMVGDPGRVDMSAATLPANSYPLPVNTRERALPPFRTASAPTTSIS